MGKRKGLSRRKLLASGLVVGGGLLAPGLGAGNLLKGPGDWSDETTTDLLIIGAGPFGLAIAAYAQKHGIDHKVVGVPMGFWRDNMPKGMFLRSTCDWSLDPLDIHSIDAYLAEKGKQCTEVEPLSREFYLGYTDWMRKGKDIESIDAVVTSLVTEGSDLVAVLKNGKRIRSRSVVVAVGFGYFSHTPSNLAAMFPRDRYAHTCHAVDFQGLKDRRVLIIGGRQSAFEWTALIREAGAEAVHVCYRHDTPLFEKSDWSWVNEIVENMTVDPGWFRRLSPEDKKKLNHRFWVEGRQKLEPWLAERIDYPDVHLHPRTNVTGTDLKGGGIEVRLDNSDTFTVDQVIFATGYRMDLQRVPFLANGLFPSLQVEEGFPVLDVNFQTNIPGLHITSLAATRDFGSFLAFTVSVRAQARIIGEAVKQRLQAST